ncbi:zinc finger, CCHC-type containing protein, partial [Tanacetum coccineum]
LRLLIIFYPGLGTSTTNNQSKLLCDNPSLCTRNTWLPNFAAGKVRMGLNFRRCKRRSLLLLSPHDCGVNMKLLKNYGNLGSQYMAEVAQIEFKLPLSIEESCPRAHDSDKPKGNMLAGLQFVNKKPKVTCWKCGKPGHLKKDCKAGNVGNKANGSGTKGLVDVRPIL